MDARCHRLDRRHLDMIVGMDLALVLLAQRCGAVRALRGKGLDHVVGIGSQRAGDAGATFAALALTLGQVRFLPGARRDRGIVRRLGRLA